MLLVAMVQLVPAQAVQVGPVVIRQMLLAETVQRVPVQAVLAVLAVWLVIALAEQV